MDVYFITKKWPSRTTAFCEQIQDSALGKDHACSSSQIRQLIHWKKQNPTAKVEDCDEGTSAL